MIIQAELKCKQTGCEADPCLSLIHIFNDRDLCGAAGAEAGVAQRCGALRHAAYWQCQSGHLLGMRCGAAENAGGAPAPMLNDFTGADQVYIACGYTDLRKGIDGLARLVQQQFALDPFTNTLFLFCGRRRDRIKGLYWEKDGFILLYKRLEMGAYQWPRSESEVMLLLPTFQAGAGDCRADTGGAI